MEVDKFAYKPQQNVGSFDSNFYIKLSTTKKSIDGGNKWRTQSRMLI